ncbi:hypothetical protein GCM10029976_048220 [Kribbella albertanoniae]|uniref:Uncharacterized protein n=1 Tax=Kribbella albertanoniae TaxID=1266829 RepID=A0A4R4PIW2_9ACTN|nr:hypothetical protein [Kribbella albertanoniae]TDC21980.1 hypothetical protein E1261_32090 [Kribbella albertanoniae]
MLKVQSEQVGDALEVRADDEYGRAIPRDQTLVDAFRLAESPGAFSRAELAWLKAVHDPQLTT